MVVLKNKKILLGVTGSIAAYKAIELTRLLVAEGAIVQVVMTQSALEFVTPLSLQAVSGRSVRTATFDLNAEAAMSHIELARWADLILIAPASAHIMAELAHGMAGDLLTTICLASRSPIYLAPAMNCVMWEAPATQANLQLLQSRKIQCLGPAHGAQACGDLGWGRFLEPVEIIAVLKTQMEGLPNLKNKRVLITAGPTQEPLDPVRYLTNRSSGLMGYSLAEIAAQSGAEVTLISGPVPLAVPHNVKSCSVRTALDMYEAVMQRVQDYDLFISTAAVADYRPEVYQGQKIKKSATELQLKLIKNPDILSAVSALSTRPFIVGFAAETEHHVAAGWAKLQAKNVDIIAVNDVSRTDQGFDIDMNALQVLFKDGHEEEISKAPKAVVALQLLKMIAPLL